jgi:DNA-binding response OmpR family regulator
MPAGSEGEILRGQSSREHRAKKEGFRKVLVAISDQDVLRPLKYTLSRRGYHVLLADSGDRAHQLVKRERPGMVIVDVSLPDTDGYELCRRIRGDELPRQPFIMLLTRREKMFGFREGIERGADDYVPQPIDPKVVADRAEELMRRMSRDDGHIALTGLPGLHLVKKEIKRRIDWQEPLALCAVNLDHFRAYNEVYGFELGDRAIRMVAEQLLRQKRNMRLKKFFLGHMVADRFLVLLHPDLVENFCREVIAQFEKTRASLFTQSDLQRGHLLALDKTGRRRRFALLAISIGVILPESRSFRSAQQAIDAALWAMHKATIRGGSAYYIRRDGPMGLLAARSRETNKRILVIDGDAVCSRLLKSKLEREGYEVSLSTGGAEVIDIVRKDPPDLIFVDDQAVEDGSRIASLLKKDTRAGDIPLVLATSSEEVELGRMAGADDCLIKPYSFTYLMGKLAEHLDHH